MTCSAMHMCTYGEKEQNILKWFSGDNSLNLDSSLRES